MDKELEVRIRALVSGAKDVERLSREIQDLGKQQVPDTTGRFRQGLQATGRYLRTTRVDVLNLQSAIAALGVAAALREIVRASDTFAGVRGRLKLVTDGADQLAATEEELFAIAQRTRSEYESTANLYARVARNAENLGLSQRRLFQLTEATNQAIQIGGSSTQEAANGVIQFSQALASGELRGDELRSVMENMPRLTEAIAKGLDTDIGGLRKMAEAGELTADRVTRAVLSQTDTIADEFNELPRRVGQSLTQLQNDIQRALARSNVDPLIEGIDDLREILTDPQTIEGVTTLANAIIVAFGQAAKAIALTTKTVQFLADSVAAQVNGAAIGDIPRIEDQIQQLEKLKASGRFNATTRVTSFMNNGGMGFELYLSDDEIDQRLAQLRAMLKISEEMAAQQAQLKPIVVTPDDEEDKPNKPNKPGRNTASNKTAKAIQDVLDKLREQRDTYGQTAEQAAIYRLQTLGASEAQIQQARDIAAGIEQLQSEEEIQKRLAEVEAERAKRKAENLKSDRDLQAALEEEIELLGLGERERAQEVASRRLSTDATMEQREAVRQLAGELYDAQQRAREAEDGISEFSREASRSIQNVLSDQIFNGFDEGLDGMVAGFADALKRIAADAAAANIAELLFGDGVGSGGGATGNGLINAGISAVSAYFTGGASAAGGQNATIASIFHGGGIAGRSAPTRAVPGAIYGTAERYHTGGLAGFKADEVPAILRRDEEVLTADDPRHRNNLGRSGGGDSYQVNVPVTIESSGQSQSPEQAQQLGRNLERAVRATVKDEIAKAQRPRGALKK